MTSSKLRLISDLSAEIQQDSTNTERACETLLDNFPEVFLSTSIGINTYLNHQQRCSAGNVDIIVIADVVQLDGNTYREAYVWELKAPQLHLFRVENSDRACPTSDLYKAENQLLHYHSAVSRDGNFLERWNISSSYSVRFGGIVMGKKSKLVKYTAKQKPYAVNLANQALQIRKQHFYNSCGIRLLTWESILDIAKAQTLSHKKIAGDPATAINLKILSPVDSIFAVEALEVKVQ